MESTLALVVDALPVRRGVPLLASTVCILLLVSVSLGVDDPLSFPVLLGLGVVLVALVLTVRVALFWPTKRNAPQYQFTISDTCLTFPRRMGHHIVQLPIRALHTRVSDPGTWYWTLVGADGKSIEISALAYDLNPADMAQFLTALGSRNRPISSSAVLECAKSAFSRTL